MVEISEVNTGRELRAFIKFPFRLYEGNSCWVPPLLRDEIATLEKNPAFDHCTKQFWVAKRNGEIVGRIAGIINHLEIKNTGKSIARLGWMDFIDDREVSAALFRTVENWAKQQSTDRIHGPLGFTDFDKLGVLVQGFDELGTIATNYNHPYYAAHYEANGYQKSVDWVEYEMITPPEMSARVAEFSQRIQARLGLRHVDATTPKQMKPYAEQVFKLVNEAYKDLYGYVQLTDKQIKFYTEQYFGYINPDFVSALINQQDEVVAFGVAMPSLSRAVQKARGRLFPFGFLHILRALKNNDRADLYLIAIRKDLRNKGVHALIFDKILRAFLKFGIQKVETNPELETNLHVQRIWKDFNPRNHKRRRCFFKELN